MRVTTTLTLPVALGFLGSWGELTEESERFIPAGWAAAAPEELLGAVLRSGTGDYNTDKSCLKWKHSVTNEFDHIIQQKAKSIKVTHTAKGNPTAGNAVGVFKAFTYFHS